MKKNRLIFYSIFGVLIFAISIISFYVDANSYEGKDLNYGFLLGLSGYIWLIKYFSLTLLIMFVTAIILHIRDNRRHKNLLDSQGREIIELKAKLYDKTNSQEAAPKKQENPKR